MSSNRKAAEEVYPLHCRPGYACLACPYKDCIHPRGKRTPEETHMLQQAGKAHHLHLGRKKSRHAKRLRQ